MQSVKQEPIYLPEVENNPQPSHYADMIRKMQNSGGEYWQIWHLFAFRLETTMHLARFTQHLQRGNRPMPLGAIYAASKCAVEGFTESLSYEMDLVGIRMRLSSRLWRPSTNFGANNSPIPNVPDIAACHWTAALFDCYYELDDFLPGLLANEMTQPSNPALSKPVN